jgi:hypothetical protein
MYEKVKGPAVYFFMALILSSAFYGCGNMAEK